MFSLKCWSYYLLTELSIGTYLTTFIFIAKYKGTGVTAKYKTKKPTVKL
jgi:hypothetical protein